MNMKNGNTSPSVLSVLKELISIESVNPQFGGSGEASVACYIENFFSTYKPTIEKQEVFPGRENLICYFPGKNLTKTLLFEAHMDTVSIPQGARSTTSPTIEGNRLYGRGACDTKGSLAAMICAIKSVMDEFGQPPVSIYFIGSVDEEYRAKGVYDLIKRPIKADGAIIGEPTSLDIVVAHNGVYRFHLITKGQSVQSSKPFNGINAIYKMMDVIHVIRNQLQSSYKGKGHPLTGEPTVSVGIIQGGKEVNTVPDVCRIEVDRRVVPGEERANVEKEFSDIIGTLRNQDWQFDAVIQNPFFDPPLNTDVDIPLVKAMRNVCKTLIGKDTVIGVPYGSDASKISTIGIPSIVFGPGDIANAHSANEFVDIAELKKAEQIYRSLIMRFGEMD